MLCPFPIKLLGGRRSLLDIVMSHHFGCSADTNILGYFMILGSTSRRIGCIPDIVFEVHVRNEVNNELFSQRFKSLYGQ